jgi:hypothetical protein
MQRCRDQAKAEPVRPFAGDIALLERRAADPRSRTRIVRCAPCRVTLSQGRSQSESPRPPQRSARSSGAGASCSRAPRRLAASRPSGTRCRRQHRPASDRRPATEPTIRRSRAPRRRSPEPMQRSQTMQMPASLPAPLSATSATANTPVVSTTSPPTPNHVQDRVDDRLEHHF